MRSFFLFLLMCYASLSYAGLRINEVMQSNINGVMDDLNEFPDGWVELFNDGATTIRLSDYSIAKKRKPAKAYRLPPIDVQPYTYLLVYCDKEATGLHTDFRLSTDEPSTLYLFHTNSSIADSVMLPSMLAPNVSYNRFSKGEWQFCKTATPSASNKGDTISAVVGMPIFSVSGGVKTDTFSLSLSLPENAPADAYICYTANGSEPTPRSPLYKQPIPIYGTTVIRAKVFSNKIGDSHTVTQSYLFLKRQQTLPIVSLVTDSGYFFDNEIGIYTKGTYGLTHPQTTPEITVFGRSNYYYGWSRPVNVEYIPVKCDTADINQLVQTKISGKAGRRQNVKSLVLKADKNFGGNRLNYAFFEDKPWQTENKSIVLRNSGQDAPYTFFRDAFAQLSFAHNTAIDFHAYQPVMLFLNGEYMGLRNLRERSTDDYLKGNYPKLKDFDLIEGFGGLVKHGDSTSFCKFKKVYSDSTTTYEQLDSIMDINEFMDYFVLNSLYCNTDFPGNNVLMWKTPQTKWRWLAKDFDAAMGVVKSSYSLNYLNYILRKPPYLDRGVFNSEQNCALFQKMMSFPQFRQSYIDRAAIYMGTFASVKNLTALIDSLATNIEYEIPFFAETRKKDELDWICSVEILKEWIKNRVPYFYGDLSRFFEMGAAVPLTINAQGTTYFNNLPLSNGSFNGCFFTGRRIHLAADSIPNFKSSDFHNRHTVSTFVAKTAGRIDECWRESDFAIPTITGTQWTIQYVKGDSLFTELYTDQDLDWVIPQGATSAQIRKYDCSTTDAINASNLSFKAYDFSGKVIAQGNYGTVMPLLHCNKTYILTTFSNGNELRTWKVRRLCE